MVNSRTLFSLIAISVLSSSAWAVENCGGIVNGVVQNQILVDLAKSLNPPQYLFIKDTPFLAYRIPKNGLEGIPEVIASRWGEVDNSEYNSKYFTDNAGSVIALQLKDGQPDFYPIGKPTFDLKYEFASPDDVQEKNSNYLAKLSPFIADLLASRDPNVVAVLKTAPVSMIKMSELGYGLNATVTIESHFGQQTKPAGHDAYLVYDGPERGYYMVNTDAHGMPINYVRKP